MFSLVDKSNNLSVNLDVSFKKDWCHEIKSINRLTDESYDNFLKNYMISNKPCIFTSNLTKNWLSRQKWSKCNGKPNLDYLINKFGSSVVPVVVCDDKENSSCERKEMLLKTYLEEYFKTTESTSAKKYYLKDWHFNRAYPNYKAYETPFYFCDDWLNQFCENEDDDFKFVYMGPKGTWTPLHADVYGSYSWSANICGRKRWLLFPPGEENSLRKNSKNIPFMLNETDMRNYQNVSFFDIIQEPGEVIFVPSGWYHQVWNLEDTISINHNWFNGYNIHYIWHCLWIASSDVEQELTDLKQFDDWQDQHQILLKAHHGMNLFEFLKILESRVALSGCEKKLSEQQKEDMLTLKEVCEKMLNCSLQGDLSNNITTLLDKILKLLTS